MRMGKRFFFVDVYGVVTLAETETGTDKKWVVWNFVGVFILLRHGNQCIFPLGATRIVSVSVAVSVSAV